MQVKDLIQELSSYPPEAEVTTATIALILRHGHRAKLRYSARLEAGARRDADQETRAKRIRKGPHW